MSLGLVFWTSSNWRRELAPPAGDFVSDKLVVGKEKSKGFEIPKLRVHLPISFASDTYFGALGSIKYIPVLGNQGFRKQRALLGKGAPGAWVPPEEPWGRGQVEEGSLVPAMRPPPAGGSAARSGRPRGPDSTSTAARGSPTVASSRFPRSSEHSPLSLSVSRLRPPPEWGAGPEVGSCWVPAVLVLGCLLASSRTFCC